MTKINQNYQKLPGSYLFSEIARRVAAQSAAHPEQKLIRLGIGDAAAGAGCDFDHAQCGGRDGGRRHLPWLWPRAGI